MRSRSLFSGLIFILGLLLLIPAAAFAQVYQTTAAASPPIAQPLMREGDFAVALTEALKLGTGMGETEAESTLTSIGVMPRNGWIADYPATPDVIDEVRASISEAATAGKLFGGKDAVMAAFQGVINGNNVPVRPADDQVAGAEPGPGTNYPDAGDLNNYYDTEGPPIVTYYSPPPDYAYLYTWVPYPFWWSDFWFPGFFVLVDFDNGVYWHGHRGFISNHFRDPATGRMARLDPANRVSGGTFAETRGMQRSSPSAQRGAQAIGQYRGYGVSGPPAETRSNAFERANNSQFERAASDRGFQSRTRAGQIPARSSAGGGGTRGGGGAPRGGGGGGGGYHGGGGGRSR